MAITAPTKLSDFSGFVVPEQAAAIFERARELSVVQRLAQQVPLGPSGVNIPVITGRPSAAWVAEGAQKPASQGALGLVTMAPKKLAAILVVSQETVRIDPGKYVSVMEGALAEAFALAFDSAALHGTSTPFSTYIDQTTKTVNLLDSAATHIADPALGGVYNALVGLQSKEGTPKLSALSQLVQDASAPLSRKRRLTGFAFDLVAEPILNGSVDSQGRPLFVPGSAIQSPNVAIQPGTIVGRPSVLSENVGSGAVVGYAGDWQQAAWGVIGGINFAVSTETSVTINGALVSLWENNLVAIRAEAEYAFVVNDVKSFVKLNNA